LCRYTEDAALAAALDVSVVALSLAALTGGLGSGSESSVTNALPPNAALQIFALMYLSSLHLFSLCTWVYNAAADLFGVVGLY
jgi:hypothetical protein